jgi:hypothetical protein
VTVRLDCEVMAHPLRAPLVEELQGQLDRPVGVTFDREDSRWDTGRRAWLALAERAEARARDAKYGMVIQDDAVPCKGLLAGVEGALRHAPDNVVVSLYMGGTARFWKNLRSRGIRAIPPGVTWLTMQQICWGVALIIPTHRIREAIAYADNEKFSSIGNYDVRLSRWVEARRMRVWYTWPSLVDHRSSPSLVAGRTSLSRHAKRFIGADSSPDSVDWSGRVLHLPILYQTKQSTYTVAGAL